MIAVFEYEEFSVLGEAGSEFFLDSSILFPLEAETVLGLLGAGGNRRDIKPGGTGELNDEVKNKDFLI